MAEGFARTDAEEIVEPPVAGVSWAAVLAGAATSLALTLLLLSFGVGMGFAVVSPWGNSGVSATTFKIGTGLSVFAEYWTGHCYSTGSRSPNSVHLPFEKRANCICLIGR